jgi:hypothetical protein
VYVCVEGGGGSQGSGGKSSERERVRDERGGYQVLSGGAHHISGFDPIWRQQILFHVIEGWVVDQGNMSPTNWVMFQALHNPILIQHLTFKVDHPILAGTTATTMTNGDAPRVVAATGAGDAGH